MSILGRFEQKVERSAESDCWLWKSAKCQKGYGLFWFDGRPRKAHRMSYELYVGQIPEGMVIDHLCCVRDCVNPKHLRVTTSRENTLAPHSVAPAKQNAEKKACPKCGGEFSFNNRGGRICRPCLSKYFRQRYLARNQRAPVPPDDLLPLRNGGDDPILDRGAEHGPVMVGAFTSQLPAGGW
jgi:hypothetical protein